MYNHIYIYILGELTMVIHQWPGPWDDHEHSWMIYGGLWDDNDNGLSYVIFH